MSGPTMKKTKRQSHMGRRRMVNAEEVDAYTGWKKYYCYLTQSGVVAKIKRATHKRERREGQREIRDQL